MISYFELRAAARSAGVPASTIERDYAQNWLLAGLSWDLLALKGGTAIRKAYIGNYRFSDDLDFTLKVPVSMEQLESIVHLAIEHARIESGISFGTAKKIKEVENGFVMVLRFKLPGSSTENITLKLDFTNSGNERIITPLEARPLIHKYSDTCIATLVTYSLEEMAGEKARALFERTRARDLYDVWYILGGGKVDIPSVQDIFNRKSQAKGIDIDIKRLRSRRTAFRTAWEASLQHQMKAVPPFDKVFTRTISLLESFTKQTFKTKNTLIDQTRTKP